MMVSGVVERDGNNSGALNVGIDMAMNRAAGRLAAPPKRGAGAPTGYRWSNQRGSNKLTDTHQGGKVRTSPQVPGVREEGGGRQMVVLRREIGDVLRDARQRQGRTLREVSSAARVSLGYLSEVERGQKEASSELLGSICEALDMPLSLILREVSDRVAVAEGLLIPDTVPDEFSVGVDRFRLAGRRAGDLQPIG